MPSTADPAQLRGTFPTMGTVASLRIDGTDQASFAEALRLLSKDSNRWEREFTRYKPSSPASMIADGRLRLQDSSEWHRDVYAQAVHWRNRTGGIFTPHRPDGTIDLAGIVKALAMDSAGTILEGLGHSNWCLNVGGDVLTAGAAAGKPWAVGLVDPNDRTALWRTINLKPGQQAVATSGTAERGEHIWCTGDEPRIRQCSVIAGDIVTADVLATAVVAGGRTFAETATAEYGVAFRIAFEDGTELHY